jgi:hypothetical protein
MQPIDIGWNSNRTLIQTEKANKVILKSSGADPSDLARKLVASFGQLVGARPQDGTSRGIEYDEQGYSNSGPL